MNTEIATALDKFIHYMQISLTTPNGGGLCELYDLRFIVNEDGQFEGFRPNKFFAQGNKLSTSISYTHLVNSLNNQEFITYQDLSTIRSKLANAITNLFVGEFIVYVNTIPLIIIHAHTNRPTLFIRLSPTLSLATASEISHFIGYDAGYVKKFVNFLIEFVFLDIMSNIGYIEMEGFSHG